MNFQCYSKIVEYNYGWQHARPSTTQQVGHYMAKAFPCNRKFRVAAATMAGAAQLQQILCVCGLAEMWALSVLLNRDSGGA